MHVDYASRDVKKKKRFEFKCLKKAIKNYPNSFKVERLVSINIQVTFSKKKNKITQIV